MRLNCWQVFTKNECASNIIIGKVDNWFDHYLIALKHISFATIDGRIPVKSQTVLISLIYL